VGKFSHCFPGDDGTVVCQHWNGSWIVFQGSNTKQDKRKVPKEVKTSVSTFQKKSA
jgi:hypothetical protein